MDDNRAKEVKNLISQMCDKYKNNIIVDAKRYEKAGVKRGLRNTDGTGVIAGVTRIGNVIGYYVQDGERHPAPGQLFYRGIDVQELIDSFIAEDRFGFEETAYLLLFGKLPTLQQLETFETILGEYREMPYRFTEDMILPAPSRDVMNHMARSVLALYSYDDDPENNSYQAQMDKSLRLLALSPVIAAHSFAAKRHYFDGESLFLHRPRPELSLAENFLYSVRRDNNFTKEEARLLDLCLVLHAEHGGGNNSTFATRVLASSGTDIYSSISAGIGSLKGPRHGGANLKVMEMFRYIGDHVKDWKDEDELRNCLELIVEKDFGDKSGLIYGVGHAVYSMSDPRAEILKTFARSVAETKGMVDELELFMAVERIGPIVLNAVRRENRVYSSNVDMYSGLVYKMLGIPEELYPPLFAISRMVGFCAHRIEEVCNSNKIMRPAYKAVFTDTPFESLSARTQ